MPPAGERRDVPVKEPHFSRQVSVTLAQVFSVELQQRLLGLTELMDKAEKAIFLAWRWLNSQPNGHCGGNGEIGLFVNGDCAKLARDIKHFSKRGR
jgi:hypothetical protein